MDIDDEELNSHEESYHSKSWESDKEYESQSDEDSKFELKCPECENYFESKKIFLQHLESYEGRVSSCLDCRKVFQNSAAFKAHKQLNMCSRSGKKFKCKLCSKNLHGESQFTAHMRAHKRNRCHTCGQHFARRGELEAHMAKEHGSNKDIYRCHLCERSFTQRRSLLYHYELSHPGTTIICPVCLELFDTIELMEQHKKCHKLQTFTCEKCGQTFSRKQQFLVHLKGHERYKCETCEEGFASKKAAWLHTISQKHRVTGVRPPLQCDQCGQMFPYMRALQDHQTRTHEANTFYCKKCRITFKNERNYKSHLLTEAHLKGAEPKVIVPCKECNKTFQTLNNLRAHMSKMHGNAKEVSCNYCSYKTKVRTNLKRHMKLHTDKPQFICDKCGVKLQTKSALQEHTTRSHKDSRNFSCEKCGTLFAKSSDLNRHLANVHSETPTHVCDCGKGFKSLSNLKRHQLKVHTRVETKLKRLNKLYPVDPEPKHKPKKKKKANLKKNQKNTDTQNLILEHFNEIAHGIGPDTDELLQVVSSYSIVEDKNPVVYSQSMDLNGLHVVESMIQLEGDSDPTKQGAGVLINIRNLFDGNEFILPPNPEPVLLGSHHITEPDQNPGLSEFISHDLNFLNVKVDWASTHLNTDNQL